MPAEILNLDEVVPGIAGMDVIYRDKTYHVPGDLDTETVLSFLSLYQDLIESTSSALELDEQDMTPEQAAEAASDLRVKMSDVMSQIKAKLLEVFQIHDPDLKSLPFGQQTTMIVLGKILEMMGVAAPANPDLPEPPGGGANPPNRAARRAVAKSRTTKKTTTTSTKKVASPRTRPARTTQG